MAADTVPTLKCRADFKRLMKGVRRHADAFTLQAALSGRPAGGVGFTVTRKIGTATERNRIRRRLRAAVKLVRFDEQPALDAVIVARRACLSQPFAALSAELRAELHAARQIVLKKRPLNSEPVQPRQDRSQDRTDAK